MPRVLLLTFLLTGLISITKAQPTPADPEPNKGEQIEALVEQLGAATYKAREAASLALWKQGLSAIPLVRQAAKSDDPEISVRAQAILGKFTNGDIFGLPEEMKKLVANFREANTYERQTIFAKIMAAEGGSEIGPLLLDQHADGESRVELIKGAAVALSKLARQQILNNKLIQAEQLLRMRAEAKTKMGEADLAVFLALQSPDKASAIPGVEARRLRVLGRTDEALALTRGVDSLNGLRRTILMERGEWQELAAEQEKNFSAVNAQSLGLRAAYHRLANNADETAEALDDIRAYEKNRKADWHIIETLMLNDLFEEGVERYLAQEAPEAAELAFHLSDYQSVLDLAEKLPQDKVVGTFAQRITGPHKKWQAVAKAAAVVVEKKAPAPPETTSSVVRRLLAADTDEDVQRAQLYALADTSGWHRGVRYEQAGTVAEERLPAAYDWTTRIGIHHHWGLMDCLRQHHFKRAKDEERYAEAELLMERHRLPLYSPTFNYNRKPNYLRMSADMFLVRILRAADEDRRDDIPALLEQFGPLLPNYFHEKEAAMLADKGHADLVAIIFDHNVTFLEPKLKAFPQCAELHNKFAWQVALSKARLDQGLAASEHSLELVEGSPMYLDTKAELLFQMKRDKEALATMEEALDQDPENEYYQRQMKRIHAGERSSYPK